MRLKLLLLPVLLGSSFGAHAATITVTSSADGTPNGCGAANVGDGCTLREAIRAANGHAGADTITFDPAVFNSPKVISLDSQLRGLSISDGVEINGPAARVTVREGGAGQTLSVFDLTPGVMVTLSGLIIANGARGISSGSSLTLRNCTLRNNAYWGLLNYAKATVSNCVMSGNGGGIANSVGILILNNCTMQQNREHGILNTDSGTVTVTECTVRDNPNFGIKNDRSGTMDISGSSISGNYYGVACTGNGKLTVTQSDFHGNSTGASNESGNTMTVTDCTFAENGEGVLTDSDLANHPESKTTVAKCNLENNGYGVVNFGTMNLTDCLLSDNENTIYNLATMEVDDCVTRQGNSGIQNGGIMTLSGTSVDGFRNYGIANEGTMKFMRGTIINNNAGLWNFNQVTVDNTVFAYNGEGVLNQQGESNLTACTLRDNDVALRSFTDRINVRACTLTVNNIGFLCYNSTVAVTNSTVHGNWTLGIYSVNCSWAITNCTLTANQQGIVHTGGNAVLKNSLVVGNTYRNIVGTVIDGGHNLTSGTAKAAGLEVLSSGKPILKDNGGPTETIALVGYGTAFNSGDNALIPSGVTTDARGAGFPRIVGGTVDIGAFESDLPLPNLSLGDVAPIKEGSAAAPGSVTFTVKLAFAIAQPVTVHYATVDGVADSATAGTDYVAKSGTLTFAPGETSKTVKVPFIGDSVAEANERFYLEIKTPTNATIAGSPFATARGNAIISNDDGPSLTVTSPAAIDEGDPFPDGSLRTRQQVFTVRLSAPSTHNVTVVWAVNGLTATPADYIAPNVAGYGTLTFAPGQTSKLIVVQIIGDTLAEPTETYRVNIGLPTYAVIANQQAVGYIRDDDSAAPLFSGEPSE